MVRHVCETVRPCVLRSATEDEAQLEKRRIQREMRSVQDELQTSKDDYSILVKKMEKMQKLNQHR